jgi:hypothetical protein
LLPVDGCGDPEPFAVDMTIGFVLEVLVYCCFEGYWLIRMGGIFNQELMRV